MKTNLNTFKFLKAEAKQKKYSKIISIISLFVFLFIEKSSFAQGDSNAGASLNELIGNQILIGIGLVFIGLAVYLVNRAMSVLHENGRTVEFSFPSVKRMANNSKTVGAFIFILVLLGVLFAVSYGA